MSDSQITFRMATLDDIDSLAELERASWPTELAATAEQISLRIRTFPVGQLVVENQTNIIGYSSAQRITEKFLIENTGNYSAITDGNRLVKSHFPDGVIYQLIGVSVSPESRGLNLGRKLVDRQIAYARSLPEITRILGFTRPAGYHRQSDIPMQEYVRKKKSDGIVFDAVLDFHLDAGAKIVSIHEGFRPNDIESCGYGVLIEYDC